ncbi:MAG: hypothetical protein ACTHJG_00175 [Rhodanobacteraceae bacterium]
MESAQESSSKIRREVAIGLVVAVILWAIKQAVGLWPKAWAGVESLAEYLWAATNPPERILALCSLVLVASFRMWRRRRWVPVVAYSPIVRLEGLKWRRVVPSAEIPLEFIEKCVIQFFASNPKKAFSRLDIIRRLKISNFQADCVLFGLADRKLLTVREGRGELRYSLNASGTEYALTKGWR